MKYILFIITIAITPVPMLADIGACYCMEAEIKTEDKVIKSGYFKLLIYDLRFQFEQPYTFSRTAKGVDGKYLTKIDTLLGAILLEPNTIELGNSKELADYIITYLGRNEIELFDNIVFVDYEYSELDQIKVPQLIGSSSSIKANEISNLDIRKVIKCYPGIAIRSKLQLEDIVFLHPENLVETHKLGCLELCRLELLYYHESNSEIQALVRALKEAINSMDYSAIASIVDLLKSKRVIVINVCDC